MTDGFQDLSEAVVGADLVMLSLQTGHAGGNLEKALADADEGAIISEMTRIKGNVNQVFERSGRRDVHYVGFRLAGEPDVEHDVSESNAFFFEGKTVILTPGGREDLEAFFKLQDVLRQMGATVVAMSPQAHDKLLARYTQVPKTAILAMLHGIFNNGEDVSITADILGKWLTTETRELAHMKRTGWAGDVDANRALVAQGLDELVERLRALKGDLVEGRIGARLDELIARAGVSVPLEEGPVKAELVLVSGADTKILEGASRILAEAHVNIGKLERMEHAEKGTFRLCFNSIEERDHALNLLRQAGIEAVDIA